MKTLTILVLLALAAAFVHGIRKAELAECEQWQQQANTYRAFTITQWQIDQCAALGHDVTLPAWSE